MKARLVILIVLAAFLGFAYWQVTSGSDNKATVEFNPDAPSNVVGTKPTAMDNTLYAQRDLPGDESDVEAEFTVGVEVDLSEGKNRLRFTITESHGYFVETLVYLVVWKKENPGQRTRFYVNDFIRAKDTFVWHTEIVPAELDQIGGGMGETGDWEAEITGHGRVRIENPPSSEAWPID